MLQKALDLLGESRRETKWLKEALKEQMETTRELKEIVKRQEETVQEMGRQVVEIKKQMTEELQQAREQLETIATNATDGPQRSYADITRSTPFPQHNSSRILVPTASPNPMDVLYCTVDVSRTEGGVDDRPSAGTIRSMVESGVRSELDNPSWRCRAVTKDPKNPHRIRITCRDDSEHEVVKRIAEAKLSRGARILRDDLYPISVDNINRTAVLDEIDEVRSGAAEAFSQENDTQVAKVAWLSRRDTPKAYCLMVVCLKDARKQGGSSRKDSSLPEENPEPPRCLNAVTVQNSAIIVNRSRITKPISETDHKFAADVPKKAITTVDAWKRSRNASRAEAPMNRLAEIAGSFTHPSMSKTFQLFQLNIRK